MALPQLLEGRLRIPVIGAPMFIVSGPELVIAQCKAGIVGSFPALNARPQAALGEWLSRIKRELADFAAANPGMPVAPFAVNQICHLSNDRLMADMETCVRHEVPIIITSLRPPAEIVEAVHSYGGLDMRTYASLMKGTKFGSVIKPGDSFTSIFIMVVEGRVHPSIKMPYGMSGGLAKDKIEVLKKWVDQGAKDN